MTDTPDREQIAGLLHSSGIAPDITADDLSVLSTKGISHDHWRIGGSGLVLRLRAKNDEGHAAMPTNGGGVGYRRGEQRP